MLEHWGHWVSPLTCAGSLSSKLSDQALGRYHEVLGMFFEICLWTLPGIRRSSKVPYKSSTFLVKCSQLSHVQGWGVGNNCYFQVLKILQLWNWLLNLIIMYEYFQFHRNLLFHFYVCCMEVWDSKKYNAQGCAEAVITKQWEMFFSKYCSFPLSVSFHQSSILIHSSPNLYNCSSWQHH